MQPEPEVAAKLRIFSQEHAMLIRPSQGALHPVSSDLPWNSVGLKDRGTIILAADGAPLDRPLPAQMIGARAADELMQRPIAVLWPHGAQRQRDGQHAPGDRGGADNDDKDA